MLRCYYVGNEGRVDVLLTVTRALGFQGRPIGYDALVIQYQSQEDVDKTLKIIQEEVDNSRDVGRITHQRVDEIKDGFEFKNIENVKDYFNIN